MDMMDVMPRKLSDQIRLAIDQSEMSRYRIAIKVGIHHAAMSRFMNRKSGLQMDALDRIGELLGLELKSCGRAKPRKGK